MTNPLVIRPWALLAVSAAVVAMLSLAVSARPNSPVRQPQAQPKSSPTGLPEPREYVPDPSAPFLPFDHSWPARWNSVAGKPLGVIVPVDGKVSKLGTLRLPGTPITPNAEEKSAFDKLRDAAGNNRERPPTLSLEGRNSIIFVPNAGGRGRTFSNNFGFGLGPGVAAGPDAELLFVYASGQERTTPEETAVVDLQRTWFAYYDPLGDEHSTRDHAGRAIARAVVLLMPGMFGTPEVVLDPLTLRLRAAGFGVLRMLSQPSRFTERLIVRVDPEALDASAQDIGAIVNDRLGECAYAVQSAWQYVHEQRAPTAHLPHAVIGISGGAISLPTVVAREPSRYNAAVLIGGGADFWLINERSNYQTMIDAVRTVWVGQAATPELIESFDSKLLTYARLDAFHTAAALRGIKSLMLQGSADHAVPSPLGDVLWERLGRPERWLYPANHEVLCLGLPAEFDKIIDWLGTALSLAPQSDPVTGNVQPPQPDGGR